MAARTASVTGLWSDTATWGGAAVPVSGDSVTINTGITVTMDVDQNGFASGIAGMVVTGTLTFSAITNTYLKMSGNITGSGTINIGSSGTPHPSAYTATILMNGAYTMNGPLCNFYCNPAGGMAVPGDETYVTGQEEKVGWMTIIPQPSTAGASMPILSISNGNPCTVVCSAAHGFAANASVIMLKLGGMEELDHCRVSVLAVSTTNVANDTVTLKWFDSGRNIDSTNFGTYSGGAGILCAQTAAATGATTVYVDQDMSADPEWLRGVAIVGGLHFNNINRTNEVTVNTNVSGPLTLNSAGGVYSITATGADKVIGTTGTAKWSGSKVVLTARNVTISRTTILANTGFFANNRAHNVNCCYYGLASDWMIFRNTGVIDIAPICRGFFGGKTSAVTTIFGSSTHPVVNGGNFSYVNGVFGYGNGSGPTTFTANGGIYTTLRFMQQYLAGGTINNGLFVGNSGLGYFQSNALVINGGKFIGNNNILQSGWNHKINGGTFIGNANICGTQDSYYAVSPRITGGTFMGNQYIMQYAGNGVISGGTFCGGTSILHLFFNVAAYAKVIDGGTFMGNTAICTTASLVPAYSIINAGTFSGNGSMFTSQTFGDIYGDVVADSIVIVGGNPVNGYGTTFSLGNISGYYSSTVPRNGLIQVICYDNAGIKGDIVAAMQGGTIVPDTATIPASPPVALTTANKFTFTGASIYDSPCFYDTKVYGKANQEIVVIVYAKKSLNSMLSTPQIQIIDPNKTPLSTGSILASVTMTDNTNWQTLELRYTPIEDRMLTFRIIGTHSSGNLWCSVPQFTMGNVFVVED